MFENWRRSQNSPTSISKLSTPSYQGNITTNCIVHWKKDDCEEKHKIGLSLLKGHLYGYPGVYHDTHHKAVNIWLIDTYMMDTMYCHNYAYIPKPPDPVMKNNIHIFFPICDRRTPTNLSAFDDMIAICLGFLAEGKKIAVSCFGGHGRTGLVLACLYGKAHPECKDPIKAIRKQGCKKWVESEAQAKFIFKYLNLTYDKQYDDAKFPQLPIGFTGGLPNGTVKDFPTDNAPWYKDVWPL